MRVTQRERTIGCATIALLVLASFVESAASAAENGRPQDFGRRWVRSHPLTVMGLVIRPNPFDAEVYRGAGMNALLAWKIKEGLLEKAVADKLPWFGHDIRKPADNQPGDPVTPEIRARIKAACRKYPGCQGWIFWDEPAPVHFDVMGKHAEWFRRTFPRALVFSNLYCNKPERATTFGVEYDDYLDRYLDAVKPDILMMDVYPYKIPPEETVDQMLHEVYFASLESNRRAALHAGIPYWTFVQSMELGNWAYYPSESDLRM